MKMKIIMKEGTRLGVWKEIKNDRHKAMQMVNLIKKKLAELKDMKKKFGDKVEEPKLAGERPAKTSQHNSGAFLEFPVLCKETEEKPFLFVFTPTDAFEGKTAKSAAFDRAFEKDTESIIRFQNVSGDGLLVCPRPRDESREDCGHLMDYMLSKKEPHSRKIDLLQKVAETALSMYETSERVYVSTSGLGVPWLHFRVFPAPKYYVWKEHDDDVGGGGCRKK